MRLRLITLAALFAVATALPAAAQEVRRQITNVTDDIYRFDNNFHVTFFAVTGDGVVVGDPINAEAATWLKAEIAKITDQPIRYHILSHDHGDHASGGQIFADTATLVAQDNFDASKLDTPAPGETFAESKVLNVGDKTFEMTWLGPDGHGEDMIATVIRPDNVAFVVDVVSPRRLPFRTIGAGSIEGLIGQIRSVEALDFDILLPGHGPNGTKQDATDMRIYLETLRDAVKAELDAGKDLAAIQASVKMEDYADWGQYEAWLPLNIEGMVGHLTK